MKKIKKLGNSEFNRNVLAVLGCIVPDQKMTLTDGEGHKWNSYCKQIGNIAVTIIEKDGFSVQKIFYDYDSDEEKIIGELD